MKKQEGGVTKSKQSGLDAKAQYESDRRSQRAQQTRLATEQANGMDPNTPYDPVRHQSLVKDYQSGMFKDGPRLDTLQYFNRYPGNIYSDEGAINMDPSIGPWGNSTPQPSMSRRFAIGGKLVTPEAVEKFIELKKRGGNLDTGDGKSPKLICKGSKVGKNCGGGKAKKLKIKKK